MSNADVRRERRRPSELRFTHDKISPAFRTGTLLDQAIDDCLAGVDDFTRYPCLEVTEHDGKLWSLSNRRLYLARVLEAHGKLEFINVELFPFDHERVQRLRDGKPKFERACTTTNDGQSVRVQSRWERWQSGRLRKAVERPIPGMPAARERRSDGDAGGGPEATSTTIRERRTTLYTLGYSGRSLEQMLGIMRVRGIGGLIDVRGNPWSMRPECCQEVLGKWCNDHDIAYWWVGNAIGGKTEREVRTNIGSKEGARTLKDIEFQLQGDIVWAVLCLEKDWKECEPRIMLQREMSKCNIHIEHIGPSCTGGGKGKDKGKGQGKSGYSAAGAAVSVSLRPRGKGAEHQQPPPPPPPQPYATAGAAEQAPRWARRGTAGPVSPADPSPPSREVASVAREVPDDDANKVCFRARGARSGAELRRIFERFGSIAAVKLAQGKTPGHVVFEAAEAAERARTEGEALRSQDGLELLPAEGLALGAAGA